MEHRVNRPRVFLSHSTKDKVFIERLASDLRRCQIEPWLDTDEIRDGRPWLKMIFEDGIQTCDAVVIYLTQSSLESKMVAKEMDAALIEQLADSGISFLPYVGSSKLRIKLRADIRALHCREWNDENYLTILPTVVSEIWRGYTERVVNSAILQEENRRLKLELELKKIHEQYEASTFTPSEEKEFHYLQTVLDRQIEINYNLYEKKEKEKDSAVIGKYGYKFSLLSSIMMLVSKGYFNFEPYSWHDLLETQLKQRDLLRSIPKDRGQLGTAQIEIYPILELQTYGLVKRFEKEIYHGRTEHKYEFTDKMYRFKYWLDYNGHSVKTVTFESACSVNGEPQTSSNN
ncbi:MAG TPA: toll/interleukin-1 receptor domain-containing protein [Pyrinomonadaceae bacterium]|nr:toll/interleukin-1 receptor domain-containing protein [Pyrinomonadaceae bacterium]